MATPRSHANDSRHRVRRLNYRLLWDKKLRIAILTVVTFIALC